MKDLTGKIVVITGASSGLGAEAARALHRLGARVVLVGRSPDRTAALAAELGVTGHTADFTRLADVRDLASRLLDTVPRVDVLAANAGGIPRDKALTADGIEPVLQANALGPWLLTRLLLPLLDGGRVVATSSRSHTGATLPAPDHLDRIALSANGLGPHQVYARAKLVGGVLLRELGRRHPGTTVADFHPGIMASNFGRYLGGLGAVLKVVASPVLDSPAQGARRLVDLVGSEEDVDGRYFVRGLPAEGSPLLADQALGGRLWALAERLVDG
ncbi:SDR family NAD(P)-dependent oxidoreductase [Umezawaea endophytica]|uniref:SDR family NAD(P)-dependent oxidoreductase n=1 Tax=Umezawaea endophytica TaxID=1654476 RepID=A0A9X2VKY7_9PSEU|nr:SDR family NAD(P)-dependent oxidoreductase [Umezawaea endophytica]MCS7478452.1 SDR family NAD(P)-dependent oxidoreductase [Umezawaea endophytica]